MTGGDPGVDLDWLVDWLRAGHVRYVRLRIGGTEVVYTRDGPATAAGTGGTATAAGAPAARTARVAAPAPDRHGAAAPPPATSDPAPAPPAAPPDGAPGAPPDRAPGAPPDGGLDGHGDLDVLAPMVGIFHHAPAPGAPPYVVPGQQVVATTTVGLMESMKIFTAVPAGAAGTVVAVLVPNGQGVDKGQPLVRLLRGAVTGGEGGGS